MVWKLILTCLIWGGIISESPAAVLTTGPGMDYAVLDSALAAAEDGDTVLVMGGRYTTGPWLITRPLVLLGKNEPVLDGRGEGEILRITADHVHVEGFRLVGSGISHTRDNAAIRYDRVEGGQVINNVLDSNFFAIYLAAAHNVTIENNRITAYGERESMTANGIHLWNSANALIRGNSVEGHRDGIYLEYVENSRILENNVDRNLRYGLHFMFSDSCYYQGNRFKDNGAGVAVMYSRNIRMEENRFLDNWGTASYGLLLKDINDSHIEGNVFKNNTIGIRSDGTNRTSVKENRFEQNGWAVRIFSNSRNNTFSRNNFRNNTFDVSTNSRHNHSLFENNYWSSYSGYDLKGDGFGDVPHRPVRLFSLIIEQNPVALMLLRSFFIEILDMAERVMPVLTPETLVDEKPAMQPFDL